MTRLNMDALTLAQRDVLGQIAIGQDGGHHPRTLAALAEQCLIVGYETVEGHPPLHVVRWEVPVHIHIQWAAWCANQSDEEDL